MTPWSKSTMGVSGGTLVDTFEVTARPENTDF